MFESTTKREKIFLNGYELWLDKSHYSSRALIICDSETSKHGLIVEIMGTLPYIHISSNHLTKVEKEQLINHLKNGN